MFLGKVRGVLVASHKTPSLQGASFRVVQPLNGDGKPSGALLIAVDKVAARDGDLVYLVKGREATMPWKVDLAPIDATIVGLVDGMEVG